MGNMIKKPILYSYSRLNTYDSCGWKYKLNYVDKKYISINNIANLLGTLIHSVEENIAICLQRGEPINYEYWKEYFMNVNIPKKSVYDTDGDIYGINILKEKYHDDFYAINEKTGQSYFTKCMDYLNTGMYRLEKYMQAHPELEIYDVEHYFEINFHGLIIKGYIDRIFKNKETGEYIIEDIKTKDHPFDQKDLTTPLQFVIYSIALQKQLTLNDYPTHCTYDLPLCDMKQEAGTKGFIARGIKKLDKIIAGINANEFVPKPSALCYWCPFSKTNPNQPEEGKGYCPYYSLWTRNGTAKSWDVAFKWEGMDKHLEIMKKFEEAEDTLGGDNTAGESSDPFDFDF